MATLPRPTLEHTTSSPVAWSVTAPPGKSRLDHPITQEELALEVDHSFRHRIDAANLNGRSLNVDETIRGYVNNRRRLVVRVLRRQIAAARHDGAERLLAEPSRQALLDQLPRHARRQWVGPNRAG